MHMADALISPTVGLTMWVVSVALITYSVRKVQNEIDDKKVPLMGVMGAFIFTAQMINFTIPVTGSSGHLGGGVLLAATLGPYAGFLTMASVLIIQSLFFGDGGLLALGCNIFNLGFFTCFVAYPLLYKKFIKSGVLSLRFYFSTLFTAIIGLQLGACSVVLETVLSGRTELPFRSFLLLMQPIHLAIGVVEGIITIAVLKFIAETRPEILSHAAGSDQTKRPNSLKKVLIGLATFALLSGAIFSWFASQKPDGLEWAMLKTTGTSEIEVHHNFHQILASVQSKISILPDYSFKTAQSSPSVDASDAETWPNMDGGRTLSGLLGGVLSLLLAGGIGFLIAWMKKKKRSLKGL